jgi:hypothetical protein
MPSKNLYFSAPVRGFATDWRGKWIHLERLGLPKPLHRVSRVTEDALHRHFGSRQLAAPLRYKSD